MSTKRLAAPLPATRKSNKTPEKKTLIVVHCRLAPNSRFRVSMPNGCPAPASRTDEASSSQHICFICFLLTLVRKRIASRLPAAKPSATNQVYQSNPPQPTENATARRTGTNTTIDAETPSRCIVTLRTTVGHRCRSAPPQPATITDHSRRQHRKNRSCSPNKQNSVLQTLERNCEEQEGERAARSRQAGCAVPGVYRSAGKSWACFSSPGGCP